MTFKTKFTALICGLIVIGSGQCVVAQSSQSKLSEEQVELLDSVKKTAPEIEEVSGVYQTVQQRVPNRLPRTLQVQPLTYSQPRYRGPKRMIQGDRTNPNAHTTQGYPYLNAPLYASPQQNIPHQTGASIITNQAFSPHEMLYPHKYHAMYGPFYYKVNGHWAVMPWGVWSGERWKLQGTHVHVNYRSKRRFLSGFSPPSIR